MDRSEEDKKLLDAFKNEKLKLIQALQNLEALMMIPCKQTSMLPAYDEFWLQTGVSHLKQGIMSLIAAISSGNESEALLNLKKRNLDNPVAKDPSPELGGDLLAPNENLPVGHDVPEEQAI